MTASFVATGWVVMLKVPVVAPGEILTVAGTWASELSLLRFTTIPCGPAAWDNVTVAVLLVPPATFAGARLKAVT